MYKDELIRFGLQSSHFLAAWWPNNLEICTRRPLSRQYINNWYNCVHKTLGVFTKAQLLLIYTDLVAIHYFSAIWWPKNQKTLRKQISQKPLSLCSEIFTRMFSQAQVCSDQILVAILHFLASGGLKKLRKLHAKRIVRRIYHKWFV